MNKFNVGNQYLLLIFIILVHLGGWVWLKPIWPFSDDYSYAHYAFNLFNQPLELTYNQFQNRIGIYFPVSLFLNIWGVSPITISLWPLIASIFTLIILFLFLKKMENPGIALISCFLVATNILQITILFPFSLT